MNTFRYSIVLATIISGTSVWAVDASSLQRDIEKNIDRTQVPISKPAELKPIIEDGKKTLVKSFRFSGNTLVESEKLQEVVAPYVNQELSFQQLQQIVAKISDYYAVHGGLAKIYLPKQDISDGVVTIAIIEGKLGKVIIDNKEAVMSTEKAEKFIYAKNSRSEPIRNEQMSSSLMTLNSIGGMVAKSSIMPGEAQGSSDLVVKLKDVNRYQGDIGIDNYGHRSTGDREINGGLIINNLSKSDLYDNLNLRYLLTEGVRYGRAAYKIPVGYSGDKIGLSASYMKYKLLEKENDNISGDGSTYTVSLSHEHPFIMTKQENLNLSTELSYRYAKNIVMDTPTSIKKSSFITMALNYSKADWILKNSSTSLSATVTGGNLDLSGLQDNYDSDQSTARTDGNYLKYVLSGRYLQALSETTSLQLSFQYQSANTNLDSGEELALGGAFGVRAYPSSEASGDKGWMSSVELKWAATPEITPALFFDYGRIKTNIDQWAGAENETFSLGGYGIGLDWATQSGLNFKLQVAHRSTNGYPANDGLNSDKSNPGETRYWVGMNYFY